MNQSSVSIDNLLVQAAEARRKGAGKEEAALLERARKATPSDPRVLNACGMRALADEDFASARDRFAEAAAADPAAPPLWINLARACRALADDAGEEQALESALALDQRNFIAQLRMAELFQRTGRRSRAAVAWGNVVQMAMLMEERPPLVAHALTAGQAYLADHRRGLNDRVEGEFGASLGVEGRTARRFRACIDHFLGRRAIYVNQCAGLHYPFLPADEFFDREHFEWMDQLEAKTDAIREELLRVLAAGAGGLRPYVRQDAGTPQNKWTGLDQSLDWGALFLWEYGKPNEELLTRCPETAAAIQAIPRAEIPGRAPTVFFSLLKPRTRIPPHTGVTNTRTIVHLPLVVPPNCGFRVGGTTREWEPGRAFAFDDTIEHEAWNDSDELRAVLIFDVWNPHLDEAERRMIRRFFELADEMGDEDAPSWRP
jgi:aspartyl/asparaginyl beta-hydroxylase (cupin superfamily)